MSELVDYAQRELELIGADDEMQQEMNKDIMQIVKDFAGQEHSGFSAGYALNALERLLSFLPLTPLTGEPEEWNEVGNGTWQNKRCSRVFKDADGTAHDIEAVVVSYDDGKNWNYPKHWHQISFPYRPPVNPQEIKLPASEDPHRAEAEK
ncbi:hypothetical protein [Lacticaseibacillus mingshuiensis]|uniref:hypothetical protein n=1 Tax=Lacticaseibacillus mingshuiensis TaxID=2799574 RepID=UPI001950BDCA|nr:hypothetical protein [Lacticaseibacillus mingshuiensis]